MAATDRPTPIQALYSAHQLLQEAVNGENDAGHPYHALALEVAQLWQRESKSPEFDFRAETIADVDQLYLPYPG